jgi:hypothetical protein
MIKFEQIGVNLQMESKTKEQAKARFSYSCDRCCYTGKKLECDHCAIKVYNRLVLASFGEEEETC